MNIFVGCGKTNIFFDTAFMNRQIFRAFELVILIIQGIRKKIRSQFREFPEKTLLVDLVFVLYP